MIIAIIVTSEIITTKILIIFMLIGTAKMKERTMECSTVMQQLPLFLRLTSKLCLLPTFKRLLF